MIRKLIYDRTAQTLVIAAVVLVCSGLCIQGQLPSDMRQDIYFDYQRLLWKANADVVILGDSRSLVGVSPGAMAADLPELRILNFSFYGAGYSRRYLDAADRIWDDRAGRKIALLGITARSLREFAMEDNQFVRSSNSLTTYHIWKSRWYGGIKRMWRPLGRQDVDQAALDPEQPDLRPRRHADGWLAPRVVPISHAEALTVYRKVRQDPIRDEVIDQVLMKVREWTAKGIHVYGFRPPTCQAMVALEDDFAEPTFALGFEEAGGRWLSPSHESLATYDASHLDRESAIEFSARMARSIADSEQVFAAGRMRQLSSGDNKIKTQ